MTGSHAHRTRWSHRRQLWCKSLGMEKGTEACGDHMILSPLLSRMLNLAGLFQALCISLGWPGSSGWRSALGLGRQFQFPRQFPPGRQAALDNAFVNAVGDAEVTGRSETGPRNQQDLVFLGQLDEFHIVGQG